MTRKRPQLECIATTLFDARIIEAEGGDRIELVSNLPMGGTTPSDGLIRSVLSSVAIPVAVMLRPNVTGFYYGEDELVEMREDALRMEALGVRHIVTGILDKEGVADIETMNKILEGTSFTITFHRAIDASKDVKKSIDRMNRYKRITHVLSSLGQGHVIDNLERLEAYQKQLRPKLILGSGVTHHNIRRLYEKALQYDCDLHVGTAIRRHEATQPIEPWAIARLKEAMAEEFSQLG